jgi:uncharacterized protein YjlB
MAQEIRKALEHLTGIDYPDRSELKLRRSSPLAIHFADDGQTPNNERLPLLIYRQVMMLEDRFDPAAQFEVLFESNGWKDSWRDSMYTYNHFHTGTHEVLGLARGMLRARFGDKKEIELLAGDVVIIPAGVGHKRVGASRDLLIVGAYPPRGDYDEPRPGEIAHDKAVERIAQVRMPLQDPVFGGKGPLLDMWRG